MDKRRRECVVYSEYTIITTNCVLGNGKGFREIVPRFVDEHENNNSRPIDKGKNWYSNFFFNSFFFLHSRDSHLEISKFLYATHGVVIQSLIKKKTTTTGFLCTMTIAFSKRRQFFTVTLFTSPRVKSFVLRNELRVLPSELNDPRPSKVVQGCKYRIRKNGEEDDEEITWSRSFHSRIKKKKVTPFFGRGGIRPWNFLNTFDEVEEYSLERSEVAIFANRSIQIDEYVPRVYFLFLFFHHVHHQLQQVEDLYIYIYI